MIELDLNFKKPHILRLPVRWVSKNIFLGFDHKYGPFMEYRLHLRLLLLLLRCLNTFFVNKTKSFNISLDKNRRDLWRWRIYGWSSSWVLLDRCCTACWLLHLCGWAGLFPSSLHLLFVSFLRLEMALLGIFFPAGVSWCILARNMFISRVYLFSCSSHNQSRDALPALATDRQTEATERRLIKCGLSNKLNPPKQRRLFLCHCLCLWVCPLPGTFLN